MASGVDIFDFLPGDRSDYPEGLHHRAIVVKELQMIPIEFIIKAYLTGQLVQEVLRQGFAESVWNQDFGRTLEHVRVCFADLYSY